MKSKFQVGDKVAFYSDNDGNVIGHIIEVVKNKKVFEYHINANTGIYNFRPEMALEKIRQAAISVELSNNEIRTAQLDSTDLFGLICNSINYASDKMEETKKRGQLLMDNIRFTSDWDSKMAQVKQSYDYWNSEYEKLSAINKQLKGE